MKINTSITIQLEFEEEITQEQIDEIENRRSIKFGSKEHEEHIQRQIKEVLQDEIDGKIMQLDFPRTIIALSEK